MDISAEIVRLSNAALLDAVSDDVFDHAVRSEYLELFLRDPRSLLLVAVVNGTVIGMVSGILYAHPDKPLQLYVNEIGVAEAYQRMGIGRRLLRGILDEAIASGCTEAWVATEDGNTAARALFAATSGQEDPERAVVYTWRLTDRDGGD